MGRKAKEIKASRKGVKRGCKIDKSTEKNLKDANLQIRFGEKVRRLRYRKDMTQEELAVKAGLHRNYVSDMERGTRNVSLKAIEKVAKALSVKERDLF